MTTPPVDRPRPFLCFPVVGEIEERRQFLAEMEGLGRGKEFRSKITTEISQVRVVQ